MSTSQHAPGPSLVGSLVTYQFANGNMLNARSRETLLLEACTESGTLDCSVSEQVVPKGLAVHRHGLPSSFQPAAKSLNEAEAT
eukprot:s1558_g12.t1